MPFDLLCHYLYLIHSYFSTRFNMEKQFLMEQNRCMKAELARHGIAYPVLAPEEKRELLRIGALLGHKVKDLFVVNTWSTYRRWLRTGQRGGALNKPGRRRIISEAICQLVVRLAMENAEWGLLRIAGELKKLKIAISSFSVKSILKRNGMEPPPRKGKRRLNGVWRKFIDAHMDTTVAIDFFTCKLVTLRGVFLAHSLVFLHHASRRVWISSPTLNPDEDWNIRQLKGAFWWFEDHGIAPRYLIRDRDGKYSAKFDKNIKELCDNDKAVVKTSVRAPDMNAFVEAQIGHLKAECHDHFWYFTSLEQLGRANSAYMEFHNRFRPHQGRGNRVLDPDWEPPPSASGSVRCRKFLGGLLRHYYREAA